MADRQEIRRLATSAIDLDAFKALAEHGEDLYVERKARIPEADKLGAVASSMANMLGGLILVGVDDRSHKFVDPGFSPGLDLQSHVGHLLRNAVDPVPPFQTAVIEDGDLRLGVIRIFPASVPVVVRATGAVYTRDDGGKVPIDDYRVLLDLARRGEDAARGALSRGIDNRLSQTVLEAPHPANFHRAKALAGHVRIIVRAAPLTVTPQLAEWPIAEGPTACSGVAARLAQKAGASADPPCRIFPYGRAVLVRAAPLAPNANVLQFGAAAFADCEGVFAVALTHKSHSPMETPHFRRIYIRPAVEAIALLLGEAEAFGDAMLDMTVITDGTLSFAIHAEHGEPASPNAGSVPQTIHCGSATLTIPAEEQDRTELSARWEREIAREAGLQLWEP